MKKAGKAKKKASKKRRSGMRPGRRSFARSDFERGILCAVESAQYGSFDEASVHFLEDALIVANFEKKTMPDMYCGGDDSSCMDLRLMIARLVVDAVKRRDSTIFKQVAAMIDSQKYHKQLVAAADSVAFTLLNEITNADSPPSSGGEIRTRSARECLNIVEQKGQFSSLTAMRRILRRYAFPVQSSGWPSRLGVPAGK